MADNSDSLSGVEVHHLLIEERFRDGCQRGDVDEITAIAAGLSERALTDLLRSSASCNGTPLFDAILSEQVAVVQHLISNYNIDLNQECELNIFYPITFNDKCSALCVACAKGHLQMACLLLESGARVNQLSRRASPLIYASESENTDLVRHLLDAGADINLMPASRTLGGAAAPVFNACSQGRVETARLLMGEPTAELSERQRVCFLSLLAVQCFVRERQAEGLELWKEALGVFDRLRGQEEVNPEVEEGGSRAEELRALYQAETQETCPWVEEAPDDGTAADPSRQRSLHAPAPAPAPAPVPVPAPVLATVDLSPGVTMVSSVAELEAVVAAGGVDGGGALALQVVLVLESILGPCHPSTTEQVSRVMRLALETGDLGQACRLFLYVIGSNFLRGQAGSAIEYLSQFTDLILNVFERAPDTLRRIPRVADLLLAALSCTQMALHRVVERDGNDCGLDMTSSFAMSCRQRAHTVVVRTVEELVEILMSTLRVLIEQDLSDPQRRSAEAMMRHMFTLSDWAHEKYPTYCIQHEMLKIAVYTGQSTKSTLYFFQENLFPCERLLVFLLACGADPNSRDSVGNSPLLVCLESPDVATSLVGTLLAHGAHIDVINRYGLSPYAALQHAPQHGIRPFSYRTLKCAAARAINVFRIDYEGLIPKALEPFVALHGPVQASGAEHRRRASMGNLRL